MCQYSAHDGVVNDFHVIHYGSLALGGFGLLIAEATGVSPEGRITPNCAGLYNDAQVEAWARVVKAVHDAGAKMAVQLQHAGRKASVAIPWAPNGSLSVGPNQGGWQTVGPTAEPYPGLAAPRALTTDEVAAIPADFANAAANAVKAGFDAVEIHAAHGYLIHQFLSPLTNTRTDRYGGSPENRARLVYEVAEAIRRVVPAEMPVFVRVSATDWTAGGLEPADFAPVVTHLAELGVDFCDVSSGGLVPAAAPDGPGYQVPLARAIKEKVSVPVGVVGEISDAAQAETILRNDDADVILIGRAALKNPHWPLWAAHKLGAQVTWPDQYERAMWR